jgi:hypothetical protein
MTKQLSPAAQHFYDSYWGEGYFEAEELPRRLAAALRAASARMMNLVGDIYHPKYLEGIEASADFLDQIAAELEAQ